MRVLLLFLAVTSSAQAQTSDEGSLVAGLGVAMVFDHGVQVVHKAARDLQRPNGHPAEIHVAKGDGDMIACLMQCATAVEEAWLRHVFAAPLFDPTTPRTVTAALGQTALLHCRVKRLNNKTVTWIRVRDLHILTAGVGAYTDDARFSVGRDGARNDWMLVIRRTRASDAGLYECQVSSQPPISLSVRLHVVAPETRLQAPEKMFVDEGSELRLTCLVSSPQTPDFILWYHGDQVISFAASRPGMSVETSPARGEVTSSQLVIRAARAADSGVYSCAPSNAPSASTDIHVLHGESPAAMHTSGSGAGTPAALLLLAGWVLAGRHLA